MSSQTEMENTLSALYLPDHIPEAAGYQAHASEGGLLSPSPLTDTKNARTARRDCSSLEDEDLDVQGWELVCLLSAVLRTKEPNPPVSKRWHFLKSLPFCFLPGWFSFHFWEILQKENASFVRWCQSLAART